MKRLVPFVLLFLLAAAAMLWIAVSESASQPAVANPRGGVPTDVANASPAPRLRTAMRVPYDLAPGEEVSLACRLASTTTMRRDGGEDGQTLSLTIEGDATLRALARRSGEWIAELTLPTARAQVSANGRPGDTARLVTDLGRPLLIRLGAASEVLGYRFSPGVGAEHRNVLRSLFSGLRAPLAADTWRGSEGDGSGVAELVTTRTELEHGSIAIAWERRGYAPRAGRSDVHASVGRGSATADAGAPWWRETVYVETQTVSVPDARVELRLEAKVESCLRSVGGHPAQGREELFAGAWQPASGGDEGDEVMVAREREHWEAEIASLTTNDVVADLRRLAAKDDAASVEAFVAGERLKWLVRLRPQVVSEVSAVLLDPSIDAALASMLAGALGAAATPEAQRALVEAARTEQLPLGRRSAAIVALVQVEKPLADVSAALLDLAEQPRHDPTLRGTSLLMAGAMASRAAADPALLRRLLAFESAATFDRALPAWLGALANTGSREALGPALRHAADERDDVRLAALGALRSVPSPQATDLLLRHAAEDAAPGVRGRAIELLADRADPRALAAIEHALHDASDFVRRTAVVAIAQRGAPGARDRLQRVARDDPAAEVRRAAGEALMQLGPGA